VPLSPLLLRLLLMLLPLLPLLPPLCPLLSLLLKLPLLWLRLLPPLSHKLVDSASLHRASFLLQEFLVTFSSSVLYYGHFP
jgi:hypothetical protein